MAIRKDMDSSIVNFRTKLQSYQKLKTKKSLGRKQIGWLSQSHVVKPQPPLEDVGFGIGIPGADV